MVTAAIIGAALLAFGIAGFVFVQYSGTFGRFARPAARLSSSDKWQTLIEGAADLDAVIRDFYRRPGAIVVSTGLRLAKRLVMAGEVWLVAWLLGYPIGLAEAVMLNALAVALRSAAFAIPGGLGVQEGGYVMVGALVGLPPDLMLATSLATRLGELIEGLPGLAGRGRPGLSGPPEQSAAARPVPLRWGRLAERFSRFHRRSGVLSVKLRIGGL